jgi:hypothetical protein
LTVIFLNGHRLKRGIVSDIGWDSMVTELIANTSKPAEAAVEKRDRLELKKNFVGGNSSWFTNSAKQLILLEAGLYLYGKRGRNQANRPQHLVQMRLDCDR